MLLCLILGQTVPRSVQDTCQNVLGGHTSVLTTVINSFPPLFYSPQSSPAPNTHTPYGTTPQINYKHESLAQASLLGRNPD